MTCEMKPDVPAVAPQSRFSQWKLAAAATAVLALSVSGFACVALKTPAAPLILPTRVLIDGGGGQTELVATMEATYHEAASWHTVGVHGGSCEVRSAFGLAIRAAVLRPRRLGEDRISIKAIVTELRPTRLIEGGGMVECTLAAYMDMFGTGWRLERELRWRLDTSEWEMTAVVKPQAAQTSGANGTLAVKVSNIFRAQLPPGTASADFFHSVPVTVRAELGYIEKKEGALQGLVSVDADLVVTTDVETGRVVVELPFTTTTAVLLPSIARQMVAAGRSDGAATESAIVVAAASGAPATAALFGGEHTIAWSRSVSSQTGRRLLGMRDFRMVHRLRIDEAEVLEVAFAVVGGDPTEISLHAKTASAFDGSAWTQVFGFSVRTDNLLEPLLSDGGISSDGRYVTDFGNFSTSVVGGSELLNWTADGMSASLMRRGDDFDLAVNAPGVLAMALGLDRGYLTGTLSQGSGFIASLNGTMKKVDPSTWKMDSVLKVGSEPVLVAGDLKTAQSWGGSVGLRLSNEKGTEVGSIDGKCEVADSGDVSAHIKLITPDAAAPAFEAKLDVDTTLPTCGRIVTSVGVAGARVLLLDFGCKRSAASADFGAHAILGGSESEPAALNTSIDFVSNPSFGGDLVAMAEISGQSLAKIMVAAQEGNEKRTLDLKWTIGAETGGVGLQFSKPGTDDVTLVASLVLKEVEFAKVDVSGKALDHVMRTQEVAGRREFVVAKPGIWNASLVMANDAGALQQVGTLGASLAQVGSVMMFEASTPGMWVLSLAADSSAADAVVVDSRLALPSSAGSSTAFETALTVGGKMLHQGDVSSGTLTLAVGDISQGVDLVVSRGFLPKAGGEYAFNMSAVANITGLGLGVDVQEAHLETYEDWSFAGAGWHVNLRDASGQETFVQVVGFGMMGPPPPTNAPTVRGSMKVEVEGDLAAFIADPQVKMGFQMGIAEIVGVPASFVNVRLSMQRRLSDTRRLDSMVTVDYEITVPSSKNTRTVQSAIQWTPPSKMTAVVAAKMAELGAAEYSMTVSEMSLSANAVQADASSRTLVCSLTFVIAAFGGLCAM
eukprot:CAMPEP_0176048246 /NCGR_PEP_ID=MMETSP0120_2-20121206/23964_1 /TAXON_ID=160619 /ORGANISM="Kryptoperidinium foliaceum, Strain CCMP 1326" /LENGTH=1063 /DNA_ID=CAMNT_0017381661 /DNA_START=64 /DNA_END=3255 /DNA_ORIENTATION=-